jgi:hypothetical protein
MQIVIDKVAQTVVIADQNGEKTLPYYSKETFELLSDLWLAPAGIRNILIHSHGLGGRSSSIQRI